MTRPTSPPPRRRAGLFWKRLDLPALDQLEPVLGEGGPLAHRRLGVAPETARALIKELM